MQRTLFTADHQAFRDLARSFCEKQIRPHHPQWEADGIVDREVWRKAGAAGLLGFEVEERYGGGGTSDFRYPMILAEELTAIGATGIGFSVHSDIVGPYLTMLATGEQRQRWLPGFCSGELI